MLVLTRKKSEMIQIGADIFVKVIHTGRNAVKIGVDAPRDIRVLRGELCEHATVEHPLGRFLKDRGPTSFGDEGSGEPRRVVPIRPR